FGKIQWSVSAAIKGSSAFAGFPANTYWMTVARPNVGTQSTPPLRDADSSQQSTKGQIVSVADGAAFISGNLGGTSTNTTAVRVREPIGDGSALTAFIGDPSDPTYGHFGGTLGYTVENPTPTTFSSAVLSDLYQSVPNGLTDPKTLLTTGSAYYLGYFQLN